jgi:transcriptional regulator with XRE-family HTH domain
MPLYNKILELCRKNGINMTEMCRKTNVSRSTMSDYKIGRKKSISLNNIVKISDYFGISVDELLERNSGEEGTRKPEIRQSELIHSSGRYIKLLSLIEESSDEEVEKILHIIESLRETGT